MNFSNSKLTKEQKVERKNLMAELPEGSEFGYNPDSGITYLLVPAGAVDMVFSSVASLFERKLRRKVGEYQVLLKFDYMRSMEDKPHFILPAGIWTAQELADTL